MVFRSTIGYNGLNQPLSKTYSDGTPTVNYTYGADLAIPDANSPNYPVGRIRQSNPS